MGRVLAPILCVFATGTAVAQPASSRATIGSGAMPGGERVPDAATLGAGVVEVLTSGSYGFRRKMLAENHSMMRVAGSIAAAVGVHKLVSIGLAIDGRYDRHRGPAPSPDEGFVGDPRLYARVGTSLGRYRLGGQIGVLVPGKNAPSIALSAISVDVRALGSIPVGPALLSLAVGFRLDNTAKSVSDGSGPQGSGPSLLSLQDRVSLGVSDFHAALGGARMTVPLGRAWISGEGSIEAFVGNPPMTDGLVTVGHAKLSNGTMTFRGGFAGGFHVAERWDIQGTVELTKVPYINAAQVIDRNIPLIPYEPMFRVGVAIGASFGGPSKKRDVLPETSCDAPNDETSVDACPSEPITATISGTVTDDADKPVPGAQVTIRLKGAQPLALTDSEGHYRVEVPIGKRFRTRYHGDATRISESAAQVDVRVDGKKPATVLIVKLAQGDNAVERIKLESQLPPGQLRGVVRSLPGGKPLNSASIAIEPGAHAVTTAADGTFSVDLAPGTYKVTVKARGLSIQELSVTIDPNSVVIKNIDLR